ncbi:MAG: arylsulfotransferase (asst) [Halobacteriales archaeon]
MAVLVVGTAAIASAALEGETDVTDRYESGDVTVPPRENITVVTTSPRTSTDASIVAFGPNGEVLYYEERYKRYFDVDPVSGTRATVEYLAEDDEADCDAGHCAAVRLVRLNVTTGERRVSHTFMPQGRNDWHDLDRIGPHRLLVADITTDRLFVLNTTTGVVTWGYEFEFAFDRDSGGVYPSDWTHVNDVERLDDGTVMASLRNQDQVVFVDPEKGLIANMTLGRDGAHDVLHAQHNPDYIPRQRGGPAVLVADSHNNRIVEYTRTGNGSWRPTWVWRTASLQWPRDADRLPNGHTLITDSNGNRVLEVDESGAVVWSVPIDTPYEAERLGTGDESTGGKAANALELANRTGASTGGGGGSDGEERSRLAAAGRGIVSGIKGILPGLLVNAVLFAAPGWFTVLELEIALGMVATALAWAGLEYRWSGYRLSPSIQVLETED